MYDVAMAICRTLVVFPGRTNVPEDRFVNTLYIDLGADPVESSADQLTTTLSACWNTPGGTNPSNIADYYSRFISNTICQFLFYDMADPEPRIPVSRTWTLANAQTNTDDLPEEVAVCVSFHGEPPITARRRGRLYLGPFSNRALSGDTAGGGQSPSRPNTGLTSAIAATFNALREELTGLGWTWVIRSTVPSVNYVPVVGGWVDNAWDTQRRRGVDPTARTIWPNPA